MAPLYLPLVTDEEAASPEQPIRVGGISLYLQEKFPHLYKWTPRFVHRFMDDEKRLRWASKFLGMTSARDLGEMTVGSLLGEQGKQWTEWENLVRWVQDEAKPDVISLSNSLLIGLAPALQKRTGAPVVVSLQGEDSFLDTLPEPYRTRAWDLMKKNARSVTRFIAPSQYYADSMRQRLAAKPEQMAVLYNGLNFSEFEGTRREPEKPVIGYLARMIHGKGLSTLVDAFIQLARSGKVPEVRLRIAGAKMPEDDKYLDSLKAKLAKVNLLDRVTFEPNVSFAEKVKFLHEVTVFSVPATYGEAFGLYIAEAQGCGAPVVQPRHGAFPEVLAMTEGGVLCEPDNPADLAQALASLLQNPAERQRLSETGKVNARARFSADGMAERFEALLISLK